jgi:hypothetical protein
MSDEENQPAEMKPCKKCQDSKTKIAKANEHVTNNSGAEDGERCDRATTEKHMDDVLDALSAIEEIGLWYRWFVLPLKVNWLRQLIHEQPEQALRGRQVRTRLLCQTPF